MTGRQFLASQRTEEQNRLCDEFAGRAMQAELSAKLLSPKPLGMDEIRDIASDAYTMADAMLDARDE